MKGFWDKSNDTFLPLYPIAQHPTSDQAGTSWGEFSKPDLFLNYILKVRMLRFSRHSRLKCRKSILWEQKHCFWPFLRTEDWGLRIEDWGLRTWLVSIFGLVFNRLDFINFQLGKISPLSTSEKFSFFLPVRHQRHPTAYLTLERDREENWNSCENKQTFLLKLNISSGLLTGVK